MTQSARIGKRGFSLLELIIAMVASTVLISSLAATVLISTRLLETPPDDADIWRDRMIADRLSSDLRFATRVESNDGFGFEITRPSSFDGQPQTITYEAFMDGTTRQVAGGPLTVLDTEAASQQYFVDGYTAPTYVAPDTYARVRSASMASTSSTATHVDIAVPAGCKTDDLVLLCVSAKTPESLTVSESGWQSLSDLTAHNLRMIVMHHHYDTGWPSTLRVTSSPASAMAVAMVVIEEVDTATPINWSGTRGGYANSSFSSTHPTPLETDGFDLRQLNVQIFTAEKDPWTDGSLGLAGFSDAAQVTAASNDSSIRNTIAITTRNGATPELSTTPRVLHQTSGFWLQTAIRVEAKP